MLTDKIHTLNTKLTEIKIKIEFLEEEDSKCGDRQRMLKDDSKVLNLNPAKYHGGDFEGKAIQEMLNCSRNGKYVLLNCIADKDDLHAKFKCALTTLQEVSDCFKMPIEKYTEDEVQIVKQLCENWGKNWPIDFPNLNITPKGHDLIFVLPEILKRMKSFFMFYKVEEKGESIHAELNNIERKIWSIRNPEERLWKYVERYELRNVLDITIVQPEKRVFKNKK